MIRAVRCQTSSPWKAPEGFERLAIFCAGRRPSRLAAKHGVGVSAQSSNGAAEHWLSEFGKPGIDWAYLKPRLPK